MHAPTTQHDPFAARPVRVPHVEAHEVNGTVQLRLNPAMEQGWRGRVARRFALFPFRLVCLDQLGTFYWQLVDGRRTLAEIEQQVREHTRMEAAASHDAVILFTKMLMRRSLIALQLPATATGAALAEAPR